VQQTTFRSPSPRPAGAPCIDPPALTLGGALLVLFASATWAQVQAPGELEEIIVTASLRQQGLEQLAASATVLDAATLDAAGLQHFADVLGLVPNLNWAGGTSRPRYFQLRGVGELEQYQGAQNPSVGFLLDEYDLSGVGMPATLFDVEQVEVLRGPQGTRYGANALAGLVKVRTREPTSEPDLRMEAVAGDDGVLGAGIAGGGPLGRDGEFASWRMAVHKFEQDGFRRNAYLDRGDTNGRDELTLHGKLRVDPDDDWSIQLGAMYVDLDNGFDAFTPDNSLTTLSDRPGRDAQRSSGTSLRIEGDLPRAQLLSTTAYADSDIVYSFDGDWGNDPYWGEFAPYDYFSRYDRDRTTLSQDLRLLSFATAEQDGFGWVAGAYALRLEEQTLQRDDFAGEPLRSPLASDYVADNLALYGELEWRAAGDSVASLGLRVENHGASYRDSDGADFDPEDTMLGGHLSLRGHFAEGSSWYAAVSRGYKAGGFNIGALVPAERRQFSPEYLWNLEAGTRYADSAGRFEAAVSVFHMWREQQQVSTSFQVDPGDPLSYVFYTDNAARGRNYGLEADLALRVGPSLVLRASLGLLDTEYLDYRYGERDLDGREQAHAPGWQYSLSGEWLSGQGWMLRADLEGRDAYYFDASHDQRSQPYALLHLKGGYAGANWSVYLWGRNVFDENYAVRGFYFGLEPPDFAEQLYVQRGDPRQFGLTVEWRL
jgi:iron complex outermembrane receptor protein